MFCLDDWIVIHFHFLIAVIDFTENGKLSTQL